jgi:hypothetical protein
MVSAVDRAVSAPMESRYRPGWLFSPGADLSILGVPAAVTLAAMGIAVAGGRSLSGADAYAVWISQFILGNSTHVILTFLLLATRRDMLHATRGQARIVVAGSIVTFAVALAAFLATHSWLYLWADFALAIALLFATHHALSQVKGLWSLYNLRGKSFGVPPPSDAERRAQRLFVPLALLLVMIRYLFVPKAPDASFPFIQAIPGMEAVLPFPVTAGLLAVWFVFAGTLLHALLSGSGPKSYPKLVYLGTHSLGVTAMLVSPAWGAVFTSGVHGLEYYFLSARMLRPTAGEKGVRLGARLVWPAVVVAPLPLFAVGVVNAPFTAFLGLSAYAAAFPVARLVLNAVVMAHYFADAFIYRFRIPEVRRVALTRLGFEVPEAPPAVLSGWSGKPSGSPRPRTSAVARADGVR